MTEETALDVFKEEPELTPLEQKPEEKQAEAKTEEMKDQPKGEEDAGTPPEEDKEEEKTVPLAALQSERQKRQEAERKLAERESKNVPNKDEDPEGHAKFMRMEMSRDIMRSAHDDYDDMISHFQEMVKANPALDKIVAEDKNPAKIAYDIAKEDLRIVKLSELEKSDDWKEFQKFKKEKAKTKAEPDKKPIVTAPNLNRATSVKGVATAEDDDVFTGAAF